MLLKDILPYEGLYFVSKEGTIYTVIHGEINDNVGMTWEPIANNWCLNTEVKVIGLYKDLQQYRIQGKTKENQGKWIERKKNN